jgi:hypothetical protein
METSGMASIARALSAYPAACLQAAYGAFLDGAEHVEDWEKANHLWQNQTGAAERGLHCSVEVDGIAQRIRLINTHGVAYGMYLEQMQFGRYAILLTALRTFQFPILAEAARRIREEAPRLRGSVSG